jgi:hypothetical protein
LSTAAELEAVRFILEKEWPDGTSSDTVAKAAIKALDDLRSTTWRPIGPPLQIDSVFKHQLTSKTHYVRWIGEDAQREMAWIVTQDSDYGAFVPTSSPFWRWTIPARVQEKTKEKILVNEIGMTVGDKIHVRNVGNYTVVAIAPGGVLMRNRDGNHWAESNHGIQRYYKDGWIR